MRVYNIQPSKKKPKSHTKLWITSLLVGGLAATYVFATLLWPLQAVEASLRQLPSQQQSTPSIAWPTYGQSAVGTLADGVLSTDHTTQAIVPIASITKIVTTLTILEAKPLAAGQPGPTITFTAEDAARYNEYLAKNGTVARADAGLQLSQYQVMQAILLSSANNYADSLAIWAYGSPEAYLAAAKSYLTNHQLPDTAVTDMSGFSPESKSSVNDLIELGRLALKQPVIAEIVAQKSAVLPGAGTIQNTNILLGDSGIAGIKTGTTDEAGSCLLFTANHTVGNETITIIGVVLGAPNHATLFRDVRGLLEDTKQNFSERTLVNTDQVVATYKTPWGATAEVVPAQNLSKVLWSNSAVTQRLSTRALESAPAGAAAGTLTTTINGETKTTPLALAAPLDGPSWQWRLTHPFEIF